MKELTQKLTQKWKSFMLRGKNGLIVEIVAILFLLAVGIFIRAFHFGVIPVGIHQDEAMAAVDALALAEHGTDRFGMRYPVHFRAWGYSQMSVLLSYFMIPFIKLFGFSLTVIRLPLLIVSCIGLAALYLFARRIGGVKLAFPVLILCIICPWHYMQSRWSIDCNMFPHVFLFSVCLLLAGMKRRWALYVSMIFFALCSYCYGIANYTVPVFLLFMAIYLLVVKKVKWREVLLCLAVYFAVALPEFLTMLINMMGWETIETPFFTIPYFPDSIRSQDILFFNFSWDTLKNNIWKTLSTLLGRSVDASAISIIPKFDNLYPFTTVFFLIGLADSFRRLAKGRDREEKLPYVAVLGWLFMAVWSGLTTNGVAQHRLAILFYPVMVISGIGIVWCIGKCKALAIPIAGAYCVAAVMFAGTYFRSYADLSRIYFYDPYVQALYYAADLTCDSYYITPDPQGVGEEQVGQILTMFCHEIDAEYYQGITNMQGGRELAPYAERYHFEDVTAETLRQNEGKNVVYLVFIDEVGLFSPEKYDITSFYDVYYIVETKLLSKQE